MIRKKNKINSSRSLLDLIKESNLVIFIIVIAGCLVFVVLSLSSLFSQPSSLSPIGTANMTTNNSNSASFDQTTIDSLNKLSTSEGTPINQTVPTGRINPFSG